MTPPPERAATALLVCPGFLAAPEAPESRLARRLAETLPGARVLTLDPNARPEGYAPRALSLGGVDVRAYTPDEPLPREAAREPPGSSALETALCAAPEPAVFLPADSALARAALPRRAAGSWGVHDAARPVPPALAERLGPGLFAFTPERWEATVSALTHSLRAPGASRAT